MSITTCLQHVPGKLWRWRAAVLSVALLCLLLQLLTLQTSPDTVRHARRPTWVEPNWAGAEWSQRAADPRGSGRGAPSDTELGGAAVGAEVGPDRAMVPPRRLIHLDLKGAPPTAEYLISLFPMMRRLGASGLLIEWEDMFPYRGALQPAAARNHYTRAQVRRLLAEARRHDLEVIPLVQTFGHLELFLKLPEFAHLREVPAQPAALCPSLNESRRLVEQIVDQVMLLHAGAPLLHIGCDEVYHMGACERCQRRLRDDLYLDHVVHVARYVRQKHGAKAIIWDDMMRHIPVETLRRSGIGEVVEPMVWVYAEDVDRFADPQIYSTFSEVFPRAWAASAYKGAFGETLTVPPLQRHLDNTLNWLRVIRRETPRFRDGFGGLVLCGWQRYDHMAVLCELLPAGVPSLALNLATASHGYFNSSLRRVLYDALSCPAQEGFLDLVGDPLGYYAFAQCVFPGHKFYEFTGQLASAEMQAQSAIADVRKKGWVTEYSVARNYTNPFRVDEVLEGLYGAQYVVSRAVTDARDALYGVVDRFTIAEWVEQKLYPWLKKIAALRKDGEALKRRSDWPARPLPMLQELARYGLDVNEDDQPGGDERRSDETRLNRRDADDGNRLDRRDADDTNRLNRIDVDNEDHPNKRPADDTVQLNRIDVDEADQQNKREAAQREQLSRREEDQIDRLSGAEGASHELPRQPDKETDSRQAPAVLVV